MRVWRILFLSVLLVGASPFSRPDYPTLSRYLVPTQNQVALKAIAKKFAIEHRHANGYEVIVPAYQAQDLKALVSDAQLLEEDIDTHPAWGNREPFEGYHNFDSVVTRLEEMARENPKIANLESYGKSEEGRPLYALKISTASEDKPAVMITAATHGNELITVEVILGLMEELLSKYGKEDRFTRMVDTHQLYFIPVVSPDGYVNKSRFANGVDPNREYPGPDDPEKKSNACIAAIMEFFNKHHMAGTLDMHAHGGFVMYPWAYTDEDLESGDDKTFDALTTKMAETNGYKHGQIAKILYPADGSSADYYYWKQKTVALGIEMGNEFVPKAAEIPAYLASQEESTWLFIEHFR